MLEEIMIVDVSYTWVYTEQLSLFGVLRVYNCNADLFSSAEEIDENRDK